MAVDLSTDQYAESRRFMEACLGFTLNDVPREARWTQVSQGEGTDTYELAFSEKQPSGAVVLSRWRITVDPMTKLPGNLEGFRRAPATKEWKSELRTEVRYLTDDEMKMVLAERHIPWPR